MTASDIITDALRELGVVNAVDAPSGEDAALGLTRLNLIIDNLNAEGRGVYADTISTFTIVPGTNPHTIGPTGSSPNWTVTQRPQAITLANLIVNSLRTPIRVRDGQWWMGLSDPTLSGAIPTDLYFEPAWPLGKVWLWPAPSSAYQVELLLRVVLADLGLTDTFDLPPGYQDAITKTLAEELAAPMRVPIPAMLPMQAQKARARVWGNNAVIPRLHTNDAGLPRSGRSTWDYRTGLNR